MQTFRALKIPPLEPCLRYPNSVSFGVVAIDARRPPFTDQGLIAFLADEARGEEVPVLFRISVQYSKSMGEQYANGSQNRSAQRQLAAHKKLIVAELFIFEPMFVY